MRTGNSPSPIPVLFGREFPKRGRNIQKCVHGDLNRTLLFMRTMVASLLSRKLCS